MFPSHPRFDTKQPPFRILFRAEANSITLQIAVSQTQKGIEDAWKWVEGNYSLITFIIIKYKMMKSIN